KYEGYIQRQIQQAERIKRLEYRRIPGDFNYDGVIGFSREVREKLRTVRPESVGQAARISGVTPAAVSLLLVALERHAGRPVRQESAMSPAKRPDAPHPSEKTRPRMKAERADPGPDRKQIDARSLLIEGCRQMGIHLTDDQIQAFLTYRTLLQQWGK